MRGVYVRYGTKHVRVPRKRRTSQNAVMAKFSIAPPRCPKPSPNRSTCAASCVRVHQHIIPDDMGIPLPEHLALSGRAYAGFHTGVNFAITAFSQVR